jgi:hypothetical protein
MKPILMILGLVLAAGAGALGGILAAPRATRAPVDAWVDARPAATPPPSQNPELEKRLQSLSLELSGLQTEIAALRDERSRAPAAAETSQSADKLAVAAESSEVFAAVHRDAILKVLADERAAQEKKREEERRDRELKALEAKADRATQKLGLNAAQRSTLVDYYANERTHIEEMRAQFRDSAQDGNTARDAFREGREWRANELTRLFGTDLGAQINEFEGEGMRGRVAGGGPRRNGADGQNGGNAAGGAPAVAPGGNR